MQQAASGGAWQRQQRQQGQRWAVAAPPRAVAPSGVPQDAFDAGNKDYAVVTQQIEVGTECGRLGMQCARLLCSMGSPGNQE